MFEVVIGIDEEGHVCRRAGFLRQGTLAQMATARHISYLLDEMGAWQDEEEGGPEVKRVENVTGWRRKQLLEQLQHEQKGKQA
jgi:hypothetical protein